MYSFFLVKNCAFYEKIKSSEVRLDQDLRCPDQYNTIITNRATSKVIVMGDFNVHNSDGLQMQFITFIVNNQSDSYITIISIPIGG